MGILTASAPDPEPPEPPEPLPPDPPDPPPPDPPDPLGEGRAIALVTVMAARMMMLENCILIVVVGREDCLEDCKRIDCEVLFFGSAVDGDEEKNLREGKLSLLIDFARKPWSSGSSGLCLKMERQRMRW